MLVQFERALPAPESEYVPMGDSDEDEGYGRPAGQAAAAPAEARPPVFINVNPAYVSFVFASRESGVTIIKGPDGRGFKVKGEFADVLNKLVQGGFETPDSRH